MYKILVINTFLYAYLLLWVMFLLRYYCIQNGLISRYDNRFELRRYDFFLLQDWHQVPDAKFENMLSWHTDNNCIPLKIIICDNSRCQFHGKNTTLQFTPWMCNVHIQLRFRLSNVIGTYIDIQPWYIVNSIMVQ